MYGYKTTNKSKSETPLGGDDSVRLIDGKASLKENSLNLMIYLDTFHNYPWLPPTLLPSFISRM